MPCSLRAQTHTRTIVHTRSHAWGNAGRHAGTHALACMCKHTHGHIHVQAHWRICTHAASGNLRCPDRIIGLSHEIEGAASSRGMSPQQSLIKCSSNRGSRGGGEARTGIWAQSLRSGTAYVLFTAHVFDNKTLRRHRRTPRLRGALEGKVPIWIGDHDLLWLSIYIYAC